MSSNKKRKHQIVDSDEEADVRVDQNDSEQDDVKSRKKPVKKDTKKQKKRSVLESDEEDVDGNSISINDIKKKAKSKAKKLAQGNDSIEDVKPAKAINKTPPAAKQGNTLFNYFKPLQSTKKTDETKSAEEGSKDKSIFTQVKDKSSETRKSEAASSKTLVSDEMMTTTLVKDHKPKVKIDSQPKEKVKKEGKSEEKVSKEQKQSKSSKSKEIKNVRTESTTCKDIASKKAKVESSQKTNAEKNVEPKPKSPTKEKTKIVSPVKEVKEASIPKVSEIKVDPPKKEVRPSNPTKTTETLKDSPKKPQAESLPRIVEAKRISDLWVDKYKPKSSKQVIGQQGDRSPMNKLLKWLRDWHSNVDKKPGFGKWGNEDGAGFRAALLSGPPGIGKTTTAQLACKELGYDYLEMNASDARNKKSIQEDVRELLENTKLTNFFKTDKPGKETEGKLTAKHCLIMDEVDGMSGNEDRGGVQELIQLIKKTKVPIICICNDRGDQKMRSLVNYCFDLRFPKPKVEQIKAAMMSIAFKENLKISPNVLNDLIASSNFDIRQCIHNLSMLGAGHSNVSNMINSNQNAKPIKDVKLGPFDAIKKVFCTGEDYAKMSFADKSDLFFSDYSIMPLFVYENYHTINLSSKETSVAKQLKTLMKAIDCISFGELVEKEVRTNQNWSLLPTQAAFSTVMPGAYMRSANGLGFPQFPQFMGKLSTTNKNHRLVDELVSHMTLSITGTRTSFPLDYLQPMRDSLVNPLAESDKGGVSTVLDMLEAYSMTKENMDSILELSLWQGDTDPMKGVDSKTKAALTRAYNKKDFALPYAHNNEAKKITKRGAKGEKPSKASKKQEASGDSAEDEDVMNDGEEELMDFY